MTHHVLYSLRTDKKSSFCFVFVTAIFITWAVLKTRQPGPVIAGFQKKEKIVNEIHDFQKSDWLPTVQIEEIGLLTKQEQRQRQVKRVCKLLERGFYNHTKYYRIKQSDFDGLLTDHYHRFMYCPIKKVSSSSWNYFFKSMIDREIESRQLWIKKHPGDWSRLSKRWGFLNNSGFGPALNSAVDPEALEGYFKFIMVRHPLDRLASAYLDRVVGHRSKVETIDFEKFLIVATLTPEQDDDWLPEYVNKDDRHWYPYIHTCHPCSAHFDFIAQVETLHEDVKELLPKLNATGFLEDFPHMHAGAEHSGKYKQMYASIPEDILHKVFEKYQPDSDMFGYSFDDYLQKSR